MESLEFATAPQDFPEADSAAVANSTLSTLHFKLHGRGWGHGVGLCQIGAAVMGAQGKTYDEILLFYYRNATIQKLYD